MVIDLNDELQEVVGWYTFGLYLNAPTCELEAIRENHQSVEERKNALFTWWMTSTLIEDRKWSRIIGALSRTGYLSLAERIAMKYGKQTHLSHLMSH